MNIKEITNRAPTKQRNTHYYSKIGNWSFFGDYKGQRVKVYSVQNREQIDLRVFIDKHKLGKYFPKVVASNGKFIVEEFIEGRKSNYNPKVHQRVKEELYQLCLDLRKIKYPKTWDYIEYLYRRVNETPRYYNFSNYINHNDLTLDNVLVDNYGDVKIVDNELLGCNTGWVLNIYNSNYFDRKDTDFYEGQVDLSLVDHLYYKVRKKFK